MEAVIKGIRRVVAFNVSEVAPLQRRYGSLVFQPDTVVVTTVNGVPRFVSIAGHRILKSRLSDSRIGNDYDATDPELPEWVRGLIERAEGIR